MKEVKPKETEKNSNTEKIFMSNLESTSFPQTDTKMNQFLSTKPVVRSNIFLLLCKLVRITLLQYSQVYVHVVCQTITSTFWLWMAVSMCLRLIAAVLLSALLYGAESQQSNGNITKQKRDPDSHLIRNSKRSLGSAHQICLLPWWPWMRTHSQQQVWGEEEVD